MIDMADFEQAFDIVLAHEGGYANDPGDLGGETYKGISRVHHPDWPGWRRIDAARGGAGFPGSLDDDATLDRQVRRFYRQHYWDRMLGDQIPDQRIATEVFDTGINMGLRTGVRFLQEAINLLDAEAPDGGIAEDGWLGEKTLKALARVLRSRGAEELLLKVSNILQGQRYIDIVRRKPDQARFIRGWLKRVAIG